MHSSVSQNNVRHILTCLADNRFHSGQSLGEALGITRAAVWKIIEQVKSLGVQIHSVKGRGYRLAAAVELLNEKAIRAQLDEHTSSLLTGFDIFLEIDSTNRYLMQRVVDRLQPGHVCVAEMQSAGRGRRGREWISPFAQNIYLSLYWRFPDGPASLSGLSLVMAIALVRTLRQYGVSGLEVKWPNDVLHDGKKLAGILLEVAGEAAGPCHSVVGVGLNVDMTHQVAASIDQPWTDLRQAGCVVGRNQLVGAMIHHLLLAVQQFQHEGLTPFLSEWADVDAAYGKEVAIVMDDGRICGKGCGVDEQGMFLMHVNNELRRFFSGEVSLRIQG